MGLYDKFDRYAPQMIADLMHDFGLKDFQAAAFPGQTAAESRWMTDIIEDGAIAKGWRGGTEWFQWTGTRRRQLETWQKRIGYPSESYELNYSFLFRELKGPERRVLNALRQAETIEAATEIVCRQFERPADPDASMRLRIRGAQRALEKYRADPSAYQPTKWKTDTTAIPGLEKPVPRHNLPSTVPAQPDIASILQHLGPLLTGVGGVAMGPGGVVLAELAKAVARAAVNPATPIQPAEAPVVTAEVVKELQQSPEFQHVTNTETHWWQQRSKWAAIIGVATAVLTPALKLAGVNFILSPDLADAFASVLAAVGSAWAAYLAYRAGTAKRPLFAREPEKPDTSLLLAREIAALQKKVADLQAADTARFLATSHDPQ